MYFDYFNVLVFAAVGFVFVFANMIIGSVIRPKRKTEQGREVYECGEETLGETWVKFDIRYYTVALVYVIFAVEIAFLFPWAIVLKESFAGTGAAQGTGIGAFALVEGVLFIVVLFLGLAYVWAKGDLDWVLSYQGGDYAGRSDRSRKLPSVEEIRAAAEAASTEAEETDEGGEEAVA
ncbi:MAG: NADH-quinone oxidoreductase subunit A [Planctomycetota bacterium]|jgi:NADH-quinone oxidoreductase subunit A|nr:NADH-quinone oxidoreductase subunit A [Planctomycetota bacterium]MDP6762065.1 NADH-quinone oxidoreductase subunit A [Planctomycetota bacterium]MDP6989164.1 NADH-quinone oxidoreductase subunit A [Planctomycetota bacterium]